MKPNDFLFPVEKKIYIKHSGSKHFLFSWADFLNYNFKKMILALFLCVKPTEFLYLFFLHIWNQTGNKDYQKSPGRKHEGFESHWCTSASCGHKECHQNKHGKIIISEIAKTLCVCVSFCLWVTEWNKPFSHSVSDREKKKNCGVIIDEWPSAYFSVFAHVNYAYITSSSAIFYILSQGNFSESGKCVCAVSPCLICSFTYMDPVVGRRPI